MFSILCHIGLTKRLFLAKKIRLQRRSSNILYGIQLSSLLSLVFLVNFWYYYIRAHSHILYIVLSSGNLIVFPYMCRTVWSVNFLWDIMTHNQKICNIFKKITNRKNVIFTFCAHYCSRAQEKRAKKIPSLAHSPLSA